MDNPEKIIVLIPAHNESAHIAKVVESAKRYFPVMVVDDGSQDSTADLATQAGARVIRQTPNQGKGAALLKGLSVCYQEGFKAIITLDGDGQHDPQEIPAFINAYENSSYQLIIGKRDFSRMPLRRRIPNTLGKWLFSHAVGQDIPDNQSGYRLLDRLLVERLLQENEESGFEFEVDMLVLCLKNHLGVGWVPIKTIYGDEKSHIRPLHHLVNFFRIVNKARKKMKALS